MANRGPNRLGQATRERLLSAGIAEFHSHGYNKTGVDAITKAADVPKGSFYNLFDSKEAFGAEVIDIYFERHQAKLRHFFDDATLSPLERMKSYFDERIQFFMKLGFRRGCMMGNLSLETADHSDAMRLRLAENFRSWSGILCQTIANAKTAGELKTDVRPEFLADFILNSWEGALLRMKTEQTVEPLENARDMIFNHILL